MVNFCDCSVYAGRVHFAALLIDLFKSFTSFLICSINFWKRCAKISPIWLYNVDAFPFSSLWRPVEGKWMIKNKLNPQHCQYTKAGKKGKTPEQVGQT